MYKAVVGKDREGNEVHLIFCPGCGCGHMFDKRWTFNGDLDKPTFRASMLVRHHRFGKDILCHSFVTDGRIEFLSDSTHELAGKTVDLPDFDDMGTDQEEIMDRGKFED